MSAEDPKPENTKNAPLPFVIPENERLHTVNKELRMRLLRKELAILDLQRQLTEARLEVVAREVEVHMLDLAAKYEFDPAHCVMDPDSGRILPRLGGAR